MADNPPEYLWNFKPAECQYQTLLSTSTYFTINQLGLLPIFFVQLGIRRGCSQI